MTQLTCLLSYLCARTANYSYLGCGVTENAVQAIPARKTLPVMKDPPSTASVLRFLTWHEFFILEVNLICSSGDMYDSFDL
jgi:hypothetical protein